MAIPLQFRTKQTTFFPFYFVASHNVEISFFYDADVLRRQIFLIIQLQF